MDKLLIKNTTRQQRLKLIQEALAISSLNSDADITIDDFMPYINGEIERDDLYHMFLYDNGTTDINSFY